MIKRFFVQETLGEYIKRKRDVLGLSQRGLAKKARLSPTTVARIEADEIKPGTETLSRLADALGVPMRNLTDALEGKMTKEDKNPILAIIDRLPPKGQRLAEKLIKAVEEEFDDDKP